MRLFLLASVFTVLNFSVAFAEDPRFYDPVEKEIEGWQIKIDPSLLAEENKEVASQA